MVKARPRDAVEVSGECGVPLTPRFRDANAEKKIPQRAVESGDSYKVAGLLTGCFHPFGTPSPMPGLLGHPSISHASAYEFVLLRQSLGSVLLTQPPAVFIRCWWKRRGAAKTGPSGCRRWG